MSIQSEITRINSNVQSSLATCKANGVSVKSDAKSDDLPAAVEALANGSIDGGTFGEAATSSVDGGTF